MISKKLEKRAKREQGFTLLELAIVIMVIGILTGITAPFFTEYIAASYRATKERETLVNRLVGDALLDYAGTLTTSTGALPSPYSGTYGGATYKNAPPVGTANFVSLANQKNIDTSEIPRSSSSDGFVRIYQLVTNPTAATMPIYGLSGPTATLNYHFGVVYSTECRVSDSSCMAKTIPTGASGNPSALAATNINTWQPTSPDYGAYFISTLPIQEAKLAETVNRLNRIRETIGNWVTSQKLAAAASDTTNFMPDSSTAIAASTASTNQHCWNVWHDLSASSSTVLTQLGLSKAEFGSTAFGGKIEYCRDFDPTDTAADTPPHYGALRINATPAVAGSLTGQNPDSAVIGNNIFITF